MAAAGRIDRVVSFQHIGTMSMSDTALHLLDLQHRPLDLQGKMIAMTLGDPHAVANSVWHHSAMATTLPLFVEISYLAAFTL